MHMLSSALVASPCSLLQATLVWPALTIPNAQPSSPHSLPLVHSECTLPRLTYHRHLSSSVTSVGGTVGIPETAASLSAGGFSNIFPRPSYQSTAVPAYLSGLGSTDSGLYNASGRGFPDVAAYAVYYDVFIARELIAVNGTSAATPVWASVVTLLNDRLMAAGKPVLGFLNPWLYAGGASALTDIVSGNNRACANDTGFDAAVGWDPVSGRILM